MSSRFELTTERYEVLVDWAAMKLKKWETNLPPGSDDGTAIVSEAWIRVRDFLEVDDEWCMNRLKKAILWILIDLYRRSQMPKRKGPTLQIDRSLVRTLEDPAAMPYIDPACLLEDPSERLAARLTAYGCSEAEIAAMLKVSLTTTQRLKRRARKQLSEVYSLEPRTPFQPTLPPDRRAWP